MGRRTSFVALCVASLAVAMFSQVAAAAPALKLKPREVLAEFDFKSGRTEMYVTLVRLAPGKLAGIVQTSVKTRAEIECMYLTSPSGKKYKSKPGRNVKIEDLDSNLDKIASERSASLQIFRMLDDAVTKNAWATCGSCGSGGERGLTQREEVIA